ncbi:unnamed protein product [Enterobius vermicularis]|uniref:Transposase n=1 Tax=Enterobius vermicularis TaxID=51028 RepID=A0A0N4VH45_ENTVE|nr:unnamed protein product [Enterobius vermicularis]
MEELEDSVQSRFGRVFLVGEGNKPLPYTSNVDANHHYEMAAVIKNAIQEGKENMKGRSFVALKSRVKNIKSKKKGRPLR